MRTLIPQLSQSSEDGEASHINGQSTPESSGSSLTSSPQHTSSTPCCVSPSHQREGSGKSSPLDSLFDSSSCKLSAKEGSSELSLCSAQQSQMSDPSTSSLNVTSDDTNDELSSLTSSNSTSRLVSPPSSCNRGVHCIPSEPESPHCTEDILDTCDLDLIPEKEISSTILKQEIGKLMYWF